MMKKTYPVLAGFFILAVGAGLWRYFDSTRPADLRNSIPTPSSEAFRAPEVEPESERVRGDQAQALELKVKEALVLVDKGQWKTAESILLEALAQSPGHLKALNELVTINFVEKKDFQKAMHFMEAILENDPEYPFAFERYQELCILGNLAPQALDFLNRLSLKGHDQIAYKLPFTRGKIYLATGDYAQARAAFEEAVQLPSSEMGRIHQYAASASVKAGNHDEARMSLEKAVKAYQDYNAVHTVTNRKDFQSPLDAQIDLVDVYIKTGHVIEARVLLDHLLQKDSQNAVLLGYQEKLKGKN